jgi:hypothetical protein
MHLLFLGVMKTTVQRIMEWTKQKNKHNHFLRLSSGALQAVAKLHIDWCVSIPINGMKFGGWVSENYLALARLSRWFFFILPHLRSGPEYEDPLTPYTSWSVKELRDWLRVRGLPNNGKKAALMQKVGQLKELSETPPIIPPKGGTIEDVISLTLAMGVCIGHIMQRAVSAEVILRTRYYIKRFLSAYHEVDKHLLKESDKPGWLTSYNYMCLLNIPTLMEEYGPIANLWEGGYDGEKYSQELKHRLKGGLKENWHQNLLCNVLADDVMKRFEKPSDLQQDCTDNNKGNSLRGKCYRKYPNTFTFFQHFNKRLPLSLVTLVNGQWGAVIGNISTIQIVRVEHYYGKVNGMHYWCIESAMNNPDTQVIPYQDTDVVHHCILLPKLGHNGLPKHTEEAVYCVIQSQWMDVVPDNNGKPVFDLPKI